MKIERRFEIKDRTLLGFGGEAESGKSTACDYLISKGWHELSFARNLKEMCIKGFGLTSEQVYDQAFKNEEFRYGPIQLDVNHLRFIQDWIMFKTDEVGVDYFGFKKSLLRYIINSDKKILFRTPREVLQFVGTEICRKCYSETYHIDVVLNEIQEITKKDKSSICISDARFINEREFVTSLGGLNIHIFDVNKEKKASVGIEGHDSENEIMKGNYDFVIENDKTEGKDALFKKLEEILVSI